MGKRAINTSLDEDLRGLGIPGFNMEEQARLGGIPLVEDDEGDPPPVEEEEKKCPKCKAMMKDGKCEKCGYEMGKDDDQEGDDQDEGIDPLEDPEVNAELFDAIMEIPFEGLQAEDVEEILEALKEKKIPDDASDELRERAEEVVDFLIAEVAGKVQRRFKAGSVAKKKAIVCKPGWSKDPKDKSGRKCIPSKKAAGGAGKFAQKKRKKKKWGKTGGGVKSARKSKRVAARRHEGVESPFAMELMGLMEDNQDVQETVRDELLDRIGSIMEMLSEEFMDEAVTRVFVEAYEPIGASWEAGRLDEDVMDEDEFIAEIKPVLTLIHKSLDRIGGEETLGN